MPRPQTAAPWRAPFLTHLATLNPPTFTLATLHPNPNPTSTLTLPFHPRARTCVFRGMWATLPANPQNTAPRNPPLYESDLPVFTTDVRSEKLTGLLASGSGSGSGGGPVEACFWVPEAKTQWRIRGRAWVLGGGGGKGDGDGEEDGDAEEEGEMVLSGRMRRLVGTRPASEEEGEWSFAREVTGHFGALSPLMRGSFRGPPPGTPMALGSQAGEELGQRVEDLEDEGARRNFRVVVIVPEEVDQVDLSDELRSKRWLYVYRGAGGSSELAGGEVIGEWEKVEVWP